MTPMAHLTHRNVGDSPKGQAASVIAGKVCLYLPYVRVAPATR